MLLTAAATISTCVLLTLQLYEHQQREAAPRQREAAGGGLSAADSLQNNDFYDPSSASGTSDVCGPQQRSMMSPWTISRWAALFTLMAKIEIKPQACPIIKLHPNGGWSRGAIV